MSNSTPSPPTSSHWWLVGCGDVGWRMARRLRDSLVFGFRRQPLRVLPCPSFQWFRLDLDQPLTGLPPADNAHIVYLAPPPKDGQSDPRLQRFLNALTPNFKRFVYVSTTAVYGDHQGSRVDESTPTTPGSERGLRRLAAEMLLRDYAKEHHREWAIARVTGIYGPSRLPIAKLKAQLPLPDPADLGPSNRIHVEDLVSALLRIALHPKAAGEIFNLSDRQPLSTTEFLFEVANQLHLPKPPIKPLSELLPTFNEMQRSFMQERRLVDASKLATTLGFEWRYADYRQGIADSLNPPKE